MIPLIKVLTNDRFECLHNPLGQFLPCLALPQCGPIVSHLTEHAGRILLTRARQANRQENATGCSRQFRLSEPVPLVEF